MNSPWNVILLPFSAPRLLVGNRKGIRPVKTLVLCVGGDDLTGALYTLLAPVVTTTSIVLGSNKIQYGDILEPAYSCRLGKWPLNKWSLSLYGDMHMRRTRTERTPASLSDVLSSPWLWCTAVSSCSALPPAQQQHIFLIHSTGLEKKHEFKKNQKLRFFLFKSDF